MSSLLSFFLFLVYHLSLSNSLLPSLTDPSLQELILNVKKVRMEWYLRKPLILGKDTQFNNYIWSEGNRIIKEMNVGEKLRFLPGHENLLVIT